MIARARLLTASYAVAFELSNEGVLQLNQAPVLQ
jgi:hypothetical protein